jgi:hypothetical protein
MLRTGESHPDRNTQFEYINAIAKEFLTEAQPVISVNTKKNVAKSWSDSAAIQTLENKRTELAAARDKSSLESWQTNSAVHYNERANIQKSDFEPVVAAYKDLVEQSKCPQCNGMLYVVFDKGIKQALRCNCAHTNFNLAKKQT